MAKRACAAGSLAGKRLRSGSHAAMARSYCFCVSKLSPIWKSTLGTRGVERIREHERLPGRAGLVVAFRGEMKIRDEELRIDHARWASADWGPFG